MKIIILAFLLVEYSSECNITFEKCTCGLSNGITNMNCLVNDIKEKSFNFSYIYFGANVQYISLAINNKKYSSLTNSLSTNKTNMMRNVLTFNLANNKIKTMQKYLFSDFVL